MKTEIAVKLAEAAMESCRAQGAQVAVAVVDRFGSLQVVLRDRFAGAHTPETARRKAWRSEEHTSELQSLMRISYAVFCLKKKKHKYETIIDNNHHIQYTKANT